MIIKKFRNIGQKQKKHCIQFKKHINVKIIVNISFDGNLHNVIKQLLVIICMIKNLIVFFYALLDFGVYYCTLKLSAKMSVF